MSEQSLNDIRRARLREKNPKFTAVQRRRLVELKLLPKQIARLEEILPTCRAIQSKPASMTEVRDGLTDAATHLRRLYRVITSEFLANVEMRARLEMATEAQNDKSNSGAAPSSFDHQDPVTLLRSLARVAESALDSLPNEERRPFASPLPIQFIDSALMAGFADHYAGQRFPPYTLAVSVSKPPFPEIAAIVYATFGGNGEPPERAIRRFLKLKPKPSKKRYSGIVVEPQVPVDRPPTSPHSKS